jgi:hypothetical protein
MSGEAIFWIVLVSLVFVPGVINDFYVHRERMAKIKGPKVTEGE